eukprot:TRINITY_DN3387_c0_g1_i1.p1 TRINITY_DN3387_c0_g1~~TRINITY_DN3387_c0_g1_i1.p1  ORF type:complete len:225 (-),score=27.99 TRINITY_DN3387_c0_g1_i1:418-1092(-)
MIRRPPRSTLSSSSAASDVYKRQVSTQSTGILISNAMAASAKQLLPLRPTQPKQRGTGRPTHKRTTVDRRRERSSEAGLRNQQHPVELASASVQTTHRATGGGESTTGERAIPQNQALIQLTNTTVPLQPTAGTSKARQRRRQRRNAVVISDPAELANLKAHVQRWAPSQPVFSEIEQRNSVATAARFIGAASCEAQFAGGLVSVVRSLVGAMQKGSERTRRLT